MLFVRLFKYSTDYNNVSLSKPRELHNPAEYNQLDLIYNLFH